MFAGYFSCRRIDEKQASDIELMPVLLNYTYGSWSDVGLAVGPISPKY